MSVRMFLAARPDDAARAVLLALPRPEQSGVRWVPPEQWHVTLRFWSQGEPDAAVAAIDAIADRLADLVPPVAQLGPVVSRLGPTAVVVPVAGLDDLAALVVDATRDVPPPANPRRFTGHLTLARLRHRAACGVAGAPIRTAFAVTAIELVASELHPDGAVHRTVATWPVGSAEG